MKANLLTKILIAFLAISMAAAVPVSSKSPDGSSYTILYAFIPESPDNTGFSMSGPEVNNIAGQEAIVLQETVTPYYQCMLVKWDIGNGVDRYKEAPLSTDSTSLYNYTHPVIRDLIDKELKKLDLSKYNYSTRIMKIADFVYENYKYKVGDYPHYPWETVESGHGDCDDLAILVVTLARYFGVPSSVAAGLLIVPEYQGIIKVGNLTYHIEGVAGHAWIVYSDEKGEPHLIDKLVPFQAVPDSRRIVTEYPTEGKTYVNQTREEVGTTAGEVFIALYNGTHCPSLHELTSENSGSTTNHSAIKLSPVETVVTLSVLLTVFIGLSIYLYRSITRSPWDRW